MDDIKGAVRWLGNEVDLPPSFSQFQVCIYKGTISPATFAWNFSLDLQKEFGLIVNSFLPLDQGSANFCKGPEVSILGSAGQTVAAAMQKQQHMCERMSSSFNQNPLVDIEI